MNKHITQNDLDYLRGANPGAYFQLLNELGDYATDLILRDCNRTINKVRTVTHDGQKISIYFTGKLYAANFCSDMKAVFGIDAERRAQTWVTFRVSEALKLDGERVGFYDY